MFSCLLISPFMMHDPIGRGDCPFRIWAIYQAQRDS